MALTDRDRAILDLERTWWTLGMRKDEAIVDRVGVSTSLYRRRLGELLDSPDAMAYDPLVVLRLRRRRSERRRTQVAGQHAGR
jgi:hypothetical protein